MGKRFEVPAWVLVVLMTVALGVAGWAVWRSNVGPDQTSVTVTAASIQFRPDQLTLELDQEVQLRFENDDSVPHSLRIDAFHSGGIRLFAERKQGADLVFTPDEAGNFAFYCELHPTAMTGTITVEV